MRLIWAGPALRDLAHVKAHVAFDNPHAASRLTEKIIIAATRLPIFPLSGRPGRSGDSRELIVSGTPYILPYRVRGEVIEILRVLHGRQRWPDHL